MITLAKRIKEGNSKATREGAKNRIISSRDRLLSQEIIEIEELLPGGSEVEFADPNKLHDFVLTVKPDEGYWKKGCFKFHILVPDEYNIKPPKVKCLTRIWHPNITETGDVCLSLLREHTIDESGWAPTRKLKDVVWGLDSLFSDLLNFDDPLNNEAAEQHQRDEGSFRSKVQEYIWKYAS